MPSTTKQTVKSSPGAIELMAAAIDDAALSAGQFSDPPPLFSLPRSTWHAILRSRRMRVFDWLVDAGFRLLNLLPDATSSFLAFAERSELHHKYSVARNLWQSMRKDLANGDGWLNAIAETEILLVELRESRSFSRMPLSESDVVTLSSGVRFVKLDPRTLGLHDTLPEFSLPSPAAAARLSQLRLQFPDGSPVLQSILAVPGYGDEPEGRLIQLEDTLTAALSTGIDGGLSIARLRDAIGVENFNNLNELGALSRCDI